MDIFLSAVVVWVVFMLCIYNNVKREDREKARIQKARETQWEKERLEKELLKEPPQEPTLHEEKCYDEYYK